MPDNGIHIAKLRLKVPGATRAEGGRLAEAVALQLSRQLPGAARPQHIDSLHVRLNLPVNSPGDRLAATIASRIAHGLR